MQTDRDRAAQANQSRVTSEPYRTERARSAAEVQRQRRERREREWSRASAELANGAETVRQVCAHMPTKIVTSASGGVYTVHDTTADHDPGDEDDCLQRCIARGAFMVRP